LEARGLIRSLLLFGALPAILCCSKASGQSPLYAGRPIPKQQRVDRIVVFKGKHRLQAWSKNRLLKVYKIAIGSGGAGPKRYQGDKKTPEGRYRIDRRHISRKFHRFLHISYPNKKDRRAYAAGRASGAIKKRAGIGSAIGIHGEKKGLGWLPHKWVDWTQGCIAVDNSEIEELYRAVVRNAIIVIHP
jgi:murein L,D-transpeptidase YafK